MWCTSGTICSKWYIPLSLRRSYNNLFCMLEKKGTLLAFTTHNWPKEILLNLKLFFRTFYKASQQVVFNLIFSTKKSTKTFSEFYKIFTNTILNQLFSIQKFSKKNYSNISFFFNKKNCYKIFPIKFCICLWLTKMENKNSIFLTFVLNCVNQVTTNLLNKSDQWKINKHIYVCINNIQLLTQI